MSEDGMPTLSPDKTTVRLRLWSCDCETHGEDALDRKLRRIDESRMKRANADRKGR